MRQALDFSIAAAAAATAENAEERSAAAETHAETQAEAAIAADTLERESSLLSSPIRSTTKRLNHLEEEKGIRSITASDHHSATKTSTSSSSSTIAAAAGAAGAAAAITEDADDAPIVITTKTTTVSASASASASPPHHHTPPLSPPRPSLRASFPPAVLSASSPAIVSSSSSTSTPTAATTTTLSSSSAAALTTISSSSPPKKLWERSYRNFLKLRSHSHSHSQNNNNNNNNIPTTAATKQKRTIPHAVTTSTKIGPPTSTTKSGRLRPHDLMDIAGTRGIGVGVGVGSQPQQPQQQEGSVRGGKLFATVFQPPPQSPPQLHVQQQGSTSTTPTLMKGAAATAAASKTAALTSVQNSIPPTSSQSSPNISGGSGSLRWRGEKGIFPSSSSSKGSKKNLNVCSNSNSSSCSDELDGTLRRGTEKGSYGHLASSSTSTSTSTTTVATSPLSSSSSSTSGSMTTMMTHHPHPPPPPPATTTSTTRSSASSEHPPRRVSETTHNHEGASLFVFSSSSTEEKEDHQSRDNNRNETTPQSQWERIDDPNHTAGEKSHWHIRRASSYSPRSLMKAVGRATTLPRLPPYPSSSQSSQPLPHFPVVVASEVEEEEDECSPRCIPSSSSSSRTATSATTNTKTTTTTTTTAAETSASAMKKAFTEFHNSSSTGRDSVSAFLGDEPSHRFQKGGGGIANQINIHENHRSLAWTSSLSTPTTSTTSTHTGLLNKRYSSMGQLPRIDSDEELHSSSHNNGGIESAVARRMEPTPYPNPPLSLLLLSPSTSSTSATTTSSTVDNDSDFNRHHDPAQLLRNHDENHALATIREMVDVSSFRTTFPAPPSTRGIISSMAMMSRTAPAVVTRTNSYNPHIQSITSISPHVHISRAPSQRPSHDHHDHLTTTTTTTGNMNHSSSSSSVMGLYRKESARVLKPIQRVDVWQPTRRYLIAPAALAACPLHALSALAPGPVIWATQLYDKVMRMHHHNNDDDAVLSPFGTIVLGPCWMSCSRGNGVPGATSSTWTEGILVLKQNYLLEYAMMMEDENHHHQHHFQQHPRGPPRGYAHLEHSICKDQDDDPKRASSDDPKSVLFRHTLRLEWFGSPCAKSDPRILHIQLHDSSHRRAWKYCLNRAAHLTLRDLYVYDEKNVLGKGSYATVYTGSRRGSVASSSSSSSSSTTSSDLVVQNKEVTSTKKTKGLLDTTGPLPPSSCALKIFDKALYWHMVIKGRERADTLVRETSVQATLTAKCAHWPCFVRMRGYFETSAHVALELELIPNGMDLFKYISARGVLRELRAAHITQDLLLALQSMNRIGLAHRDVKPANVLMMPVVLSAGSEGSGGGRAFEGKGSTAVSTSSCHYYVPSCKLADFGMSTFVGVDGQLRGRCGTPGYVAPEIFTAGVHGGYGNKVDVFSAGVTLYVMLCGYEPFYGETDTELIAANKAAHIEFPPEDWQDISESAKDLVSKMMCPDPTRRLNPSQALDHPWFNPVRHLIGGGGRSGNRRLDSDLDRSSTSSRTTTMLSKSEAAPMEEACVVS